MYKNPSTSKKSSTSKALREGDILWPNAYIIFQKIVQKWKPAFISRHSSNILFFSTSHVNYSYDVNACYWSFDSGFSAKNPLKNYFRWSLWKIENLNLILINAEDGYYIHVMAQVQTTKYSTFCILYA